MSDLSRMKPIDAAKKFIELHFPQCQGALLSGSVVRGQETKTSDLDIIIFDKSISSSYRESLIEFDWYIEAFVHNLNSYKMFFKSDVERARPSMPRMVNEGMILKDEGIIAPIKSEAKQLLENGPSEWSPETIKLKRYFITDALDDFIGCTDRGEELFIANHLADCISEFVLRTNQQWIGTSKWVIRSLREYDVTFTQQFIEAFDVYYKTGNKDKVIYLVDIVLEPYGGRLFDGFTLGK